METQEDLLNLIDRRIKLRFIKEKKASRTYIEGLDKFFETTVIKEIVKKIQKKLSTGYNSISDTEENIIAHGFNGEHKERIRKILVEEYNISADKIIMSS
jgi:translation initiation factor 1 (eIF-1/SUI1)